MRIFLSSLLSGIKLLNHYFLQIPYGGAQVPQVRHLCDGTTQNPVREGTQTGPERKKPRVFERETGML